jgi:hypothetical protein
MYYELTNSFNGYSPGTVFKRISVYGEGHVDACKLEALDQGGVATKRINVTEAELDELFVETNEPSTA